jgi:hypothetical protein
VNEPHSQPAGSPEPAQESTSTGHHLVDEVLDSLAVLPDLPVAEHVAVLDRAHDRLRDALSDGGT